MQTKLHCIICGTLIHNGLYCSECQNEISRSRSIDDEPLEEWLSNMRIGRSISYDDEEKNFTLDRFGWLKDINER
ncbi:MAG: nucleotide-binding protein [Thermoplasmata archaeon]